MKILVCIKQVPDMESKFQINGAGTSIEEADLAFRMNEYDEFAVEEAVRLKEKVGEAELVSISLGPDRVTEAIKKSLAMGCDRAIHIQDSEERDPVQVAGLLQAAIKEENFDVIFTGMQSQDLGSAQVGILLAEMLGIESISTLVALEQDGDGFIAKRELEAGQKMVLKVKSPVLFTCQMGLNTPRYPTLPNIMKAKKKEIIKLDGASLSAPAAKVKTKSLAPPAKKGQAQFLEGDLNDMADQLIEQLKSKTSALS